MNAHINLYLNTATLKNAHVILNRLKKVIKFSVMDVSIYHKGGIKAELEANIEAEKWPDIVFESIALAQNIGTSWTINASIYEELFMQSDSFHESGIEFGTFKVLD